jgi:hypothetical protein
MNRRERRRQAAMQRHNSFYNNYVRHLPEVGPEGLGKPGVSHIVFCHDDWCRIYEGKGCNCDPDVKFFAEPQRS